MSSAEGMEETVRPRSLWLTAPLYAGMLAILALDLWTMTFWMRVGGALGWAITGTELLVALVLGLVLVVDARRQWLLSGPPDSPVE
jgi:hypothetical protein